jgi:hypothetical protein
MKTKAQQQFPIKLALITMVILFSSCVSYQRTSAFDLQKSYFQGSAGTPKSGYCGGRCDR